MRPLRVSSATAISWQPMLLQSLVTLGALAKAAEAPMTISRQQSMDKYAGHLSQHFPYISFSGLRHFLQTGNFSGQTQQQQSPGHISTKTANPIQCGNTIRIVQEPGSGTLSSNIIFSICSSLRQEYALIRGWVWLRSVSVKLSLQYQQTSTRLLLRFVDILVAPSSTQMMAVTSERTNRHLLIIFIIFIFMRASLNQYLIQDLWFAIFQTKLQTFVFQKLSVLWQSQNTILNSLISEKMKNILNSLIQIILINKHKLVKQKILQSMKTFVSLLLLLLTCNFINATVVPHVGPIKTHVPRIYKVSLDDPPLVRWAHIVKDYSEPLKRFMDYFDLLPLPHDFFKGVEWYAKNEFSHKDFVAEVDALSQLSGYPFEKIFFINFMYEFSTFKACSSILIRNSAGKVMHGRNLDFEMWELLSKLVVNVEYYQGQKMMFSVDTVVGSVFALTAIKPGAFAVNVNTRYAEHFYKDLISVMLEDAVPTCWLLMKVLKEEVTYDRAVNKLKTVRISSPVYYTISGTGPNEGCVIEREVNSVHASYQLNATNWFIVQTNYDRDQPDPLHDPRRVPVENRIRERGNLHFETQDLFTDFMAEWPTFNIATIMTATMVAATGYHNTTVWYGYNPTPAPSSLTAEEE